MDSFFENKIKIIHFCQCGKTDLRCRGIRKTQTR